MKSRAAWQNLEIAGALLVETVKAEYPPRAMVYWRRRGHLQMGKIIKVLGTHDARHLRLRVENVSTHKIVDVRVGDIEGIGA